MMTLATIVLFAGSGLAIAAIWNRFFDPVPWRFVLLFFAVVAAFESRTLFTPQVDLPTGLANFAYPWKALSSAPTSANTGIVLTQIGPWTRIARDSILGGEWPLWNRHSASGAPLMANQQTAIFHPFTLFGILLLSLGKSFTYTASLRLFTVLFFTFVMLRGHQIREEACVYGAVAYAFSTFHIVWLLFPLGLATMMLPIAMTGVQLVAHSAKRRAFLVLTAGLTLSVLGGHPESAFWVWFVTAAYAAYICRHQWRRFSTLALAFAAAAGLSAFFWMPTVALLPRIARTSLMASMVTNPPNHYLSAEFLETLIAPNILGTPQTATYAPPRRRHPAVLDDYGEIASGYAGIATLALAMYALLSPRRPDRLFFAALSLFAFLTIAEIPIWRELLRHVPVVGLTMHQRLRVMWVLGAIALSALALDVEIDRRRFRVVLTIVWIAVIAMYAIERPESVVAWVTLIASSAAALVLWIAPPTPRLAAIVTFCELCIVGFGYNPAGFGDAPAATGAVVTMQRSAHLSRIAALGWSLPPDTPGYYGLEDVKSTDPVSDPVYKRLMHGFLHTIPSYDEVFDDVSEPFFDFLNIRWVYVPPDVAFAQKRFIRRYSGADGAVYENTTALPRYFVPVRYRVNTALSHTILTLKSFSDFRIEAVVDHIPAKIAEKARELVPRDIDEWKTVAPAQVRVTRYRNNSTTLDVVSTGWSLLATSDTNWPGWRAYVNGERQPPITVNGAFLGCFLPPGHATVEFRYIPREFEIGVRITVLSALALALLAIARQLRKT